MTRKSYLLIETPAGERLMVKSMAGHEGCTVIRDRVPEPPGPHCRLCPKGRWIDDPAAAERERLNRMTQAELVDEMLRRARGP